MKKRKLFYFVLAVMAMSITLLCACVGVKDPPPDPSGETVRAEIFVPVASVSLKVGDKRNLNACIQNADTEEELTGGTLAYASSDPQSVSVSESGELTALKTCQNVIVTVSGTYDGEPLESEEVPVTVTEEMSVSTNIENNFLTLYTSEGRDSENPFTTSYELHPTVVVSGKTVEDADIEVVSSDPQIVKAENTRLTALKAGNVTVTITATSAAGTRASATVEISVSKPISQITYADEPVIDVEKGVDWTSFGIDGVPVSLGIEGVDVTYEFESGRLTLDNSPVVGDNLDFRIELEDEILETKITVATMTISSVKDLKDFADKYKDFNDAAKTPVSPYVVLTADIDMPEEDKGYLQDKTSNGGGAWRGTLDGKGHTINNLTLWHGFMGQIAAEGVVKNLAVTNMVKDIRPTGIISQECRGTIENCYFQGITVGEQPDRWYVPFISILHHGASVKNVVLNMTSRPADGKNTIMDTYDTATIENLFVIVRGGSGKLTDKDAFNQNGGVYTDVNAFKETAERNLQTFGGYWTTEPGTLIFKSAVKYFTPENSGGKTITSDGEILVGGNTVLKTNFDAIRWFLKEEIDGVQIQNGVLSVGENVADGTKVTVCAVGYDLVLGTEYQVESEEFTIKGAESIVLSGKLVTGDNRKDVFTLDMSEKQVTEIISVTYNNQEVTGYSLKGTNFALDLSGLEKGDGSLNISAKTKAGTFCTYIQEVEKVDYAIGSLKEFMGLADRLKEIGSNNSLKETKRKTSQKGEYLTVVLTDDIDCKGADFTARAGKVEFVGSFDGRGHTLFNLHGTNSLFVSLNGLPKKYSYFQNVAFVNAVVKAENANYLTSDSWGTGAAFIYCVNKTNLHDVYVDVTVQDCTDPTFCLFRVTEQSSSHYSLFGNVVAVINYDTSCNFGETGLTAGVTVSAPGSFINCHVVCNVTPTSGAFSVDQGDYRSLGVYLYATVNEMMSAIDNQLPAMPVIPEKPIEPIAPAEDASEEEKAAYQAALAEYETKKAAYDAVVSSVKDRFERAYLYLKEHADGFSSDIWEIRSSGDKKALIFRSAEITGLTISSSYPDGKITTGTSVTFTAFGASKWRVEGLEDGMYTLKNGVLILDNTIANGTQFKIIAEYTDIFGVKYTAEKLLTVENLEKKTESLDEILVGKNRADENYEIEIGSGESTIEVTINGESVDFTVENGKVLLSSAMLKGYGVNAIHEINVVTITTTTITTYVCKLSVWDFAVGTVEEWNEFEHAKDSNHSKETPLYVVLTADLDFGGDYEPPRKDSDSWYSLDGKGHTIQNVSVSASHSFLGDVRGTADQRAYVRNVIFKNLTQKDGHGGLLCLDAEYCDFENLYIEGTILTTNSPLVAGIVGRDGAYGASSSTGVSFRNVVVNVTFGVTDSYNAVIAGTASSLENVYAISSTSNGNLGGVRGEHTGLYGTVDDFKAAIQNITLGDAWTLTETELKLYGKTVLIFETVS